VELATLPPGSRSRLKKLRFFLIFLALLLLGLVSFAFGMFMAVASDLPSLEDQQQYNDARNSVLLDDRGREIGVLSRQNQILVTPNQIPPIVKEAVISIEDKRFMTNPGVDFRSIARAFVADVLHQGSVQGASTIEQQFVKNALQEQAHRTIFEKLREAALAFHLAREWSKEKIITEYLNTIYFGNGAYGIESAARTYFSQDSGHQGCGLPKQRLCVEELEPWEAALLAGIIQSPTYYNPITNPDAARRRRNLVLYEMLQQGYIDRSIYQTSIAQPLPPAKDIGEPRQPLVDGIDTGYFDAWVGQQIINRYHAGLAYDGGLRIKTTLDLELQRSAEQAIDNYLASPEGPSASLVAIENSTGKVRAMVGGRDYNQTPFNLATEGERQPGSSFKAFDLAAALEDGISPYSVWPSEPKVFHLPGEVFSVHNDEGAYSGESSLLNATAYSDNSVYAEVGLHVGTHRIAALAHRMGIVTPLSTNAAMTIGGLKIGVTPLDMAHAYETIAHGGQRVGGTLGERRMPVGIEEVSTKTRTLPDGHRREVDHTTLTPVLPASVARTETEVLETVLQYGTAHAASLGQFAAGKTGTTSNYGDAWFVGWDSKYTVAVWVGFPNSLVPMKTEFQGGPVLGGTFPALIWHDFMVAAMAVEKQRAAEELAKREAAKVGHKGTSSTEEVAPAPSETGTAATGREASSPSHEGLSQSHEGGSAGKAQTPARGAGEHSEAPTRETPAEGSPQQQAPSGTATPQTPSPSPSPTPSEQSGSSEAQAPKVSGGTGAPSGGAKAPG
jgi:penicillin-binding protein 1A